MTIFSATDAALRAFDTRPTRAEALADLSRHFREAGMNEVAAMFARRGLAVPPNGDLLFVEGVRPELATDLAISGYYSHDPETRRLAGEECDALALDRDAPRHIVDHARNVLFWHAPKLVELAPSWQTQQIEFKAPPGWVAMNPSVTRHLGRTVAIVRVVNYWIKPDGGYTFPQGEPAISTRNFLVELKPLGVAINPIEVIPDLGPMLYDGVRGLEDLRIFPWNGELRFIAAARQMNSDGWVEQVVGRLNFDGTIDGLEVVRQPWRAPCEKNWMPIIGAESRWREPQYVYRCDPTTVVAAGLVGNPEQWPAPIAADNFSGSSQLVPFDDGWLCMTHEPLASPLNGRRLNQQRFVFFDANLRVASCSRRFIFQLNEEIEYVTGLCREDDSGDKLIISYGSHDRQAWVGTIEANDVRRMLRPCKPNTIVESSDKPVERKVSPVDLFPSWKATRLIFAPPEGFAARSPSVINHRGRLLASVRCMNYAPNDDAGYHRIADGALDYKPVSRTFLIELDPDTLSDSALGELGLPYTLGEPRDGAPAHGLEDMRLFEWSGDLWGIAAFAEQSVDGNPEQWVVRISGNETLSDARRIVPNGVPRGAEKNWVPFVGLSEPRFMYSVDPTVIIDAWGHIVFGRPSNLSAESFHGGSQVIPFDGGWLAIVHRQKIFDEDNKWVDFEYRNQFVWLDREFNLKQISPVLEFPINHAIPSFPRRFQFAHGLAWHPDGKRLVVGYDLYEREPWVATVDASDIGKVLGLNDKSSSKMEFDELDQTNRALQDSSAIAWATQKLRVEGLPECSAAHYKNWDTWLGIWHAYRGYGPDDPILDAGGDRHSAFLPGMRVLGYKNLLNLNIDEPSPRMENGILWRRGDITSTGLPDRSQRFVMCQSVLEHNVDWGKFFDEMGRVIARGGQLFVSIDYWESEIDANVKIFDAVEARAMIGRAANNGLQLSRPVNTSCRDACVEWGGLKYTFLNLLFTAE